MSIPKQKSGGRVGKEIAARLPCLPHVPIAVCSQASGLGCVGSCPTTTTSRRSTRRAQFGIIMVAVDPPEEVREAKDCVKIIAIGDSSVGKSNLLRSFVQDSNNAWGDRPANTGIETLVKKVVTGGTNIDVMLWDTAGSERFRTLTRSFYHLVDGVILAYDIASRESFDSLASWFTELQHSRAPKHAVLAVVGTKVDRDDRCVSYQEGHAFAQKHKSLFYETSAVSGQGIDTLFTELVERAFEAQRSAEPKPQPKVVYLAAPPPEPQASPGRCLC
ncbi:ras-domain-containing protein [Phanerochaete sordida]|uniref:Ras-domain-containing protein n=1 Tax=Phanerochaete sordida TaxID=48140 RepID=A0A9P3GCC5_9APHY|nr:ras-domain-containing protein [Phanerochaete sordida]